MNIIEVMDDRELFAGHFSGESWDRWRVFLKALSGLPLPDAEMAAYCHHTGRTTPPATAFTEASLICGRRGASRGCWG